MNGEKRTLNFVIQDPPVQEFPNLKNSILINIFGETFDSKVASSINHSIIDALETSTKKVFVVMTIHDLNLSPIDSIGFINMFKEGDLYRRMAKNPNMQGFILVFGEQNPANEMLKRVAAIGEKLVVNPLGTRLFTVVNLEETDALIKTTLSE